MENPISKEITLSIILLLAIILAPYSILCTNSTFHQILNEKFSAIKSDKMTDNVADYLRGQTSLDQEFFSIQAIKHMYDVKNIVQSIKSVTIMLWIILIVLLAIWRDIDHKRLMIRSVKYAKYLLIAFLFMAILFNQSFFLFHNIAFNNDDWAFPADDTLINLYTQEFFQIFFIISTTISVLMLVIVYIIFTRLPSKISIPKAIRRSKPVRKTRNKK
jgi:integral membrane protein (TIGR01906 family)